MPQFPRQPLFRFVTEKIEAFHDWRFRKLLELRLDDVLRRKNPYLFKAKALEIISRH